MQRLLVLVQTNCLHGCAITKSLLLQDRGYFTVKETAVNTNHGIQISFTTKITGRGQQWLTRKLLDNGMLKVTGEAA
nr:phage antirepressor KilAC domain-containing protein [Escherichia coli]